MGTNYYHHATDEKPHCPSCECFWRRHIGKSSGGWQFSFQAYEGIRSWKDWQEVLTKGGTIVNDSGETYTLENFKALVEAKQTEELNHTVYLLENEHQYGKVDPDRDWRDSEGYSFSTSEFT